MKCFAVMRATGRYLQYNTYSGVVRTAWDWVHRDGATVFSGEASAKAAVDAIQQKTGLIITHQIIPLDTDAALKVLRDLSDVCDLGDLIYHVRENEGQGWDGPLVTKWGDAVMQAKQLLAEYEKQTLAQRKLDEFKLDSLDQNDLHTL